MRSWLNSRSGLIDEVAIFERALTDYEIRTLREHVESGKPLPAPRKGPAAKTASSGEAPAAAQC